MMMMMTMMTMVMTMTMMMVMTMMMMMMMMMRRGEYDNVLKIFVKTIDENMSHVLVIKSARALVCCSHTAPMYT